MKKEHINIANILTFSRIILGLMFLLIFIIIKYKYFLINNINILVLEIISFFIYISAIITDGLDGYFARKKDKVTDFGKHFDPLSDSIFFIIVFFTFFILGLMPIYFLIIIFIREAFMHAFLRPYIKSKGTSLPASIYGKIKTVFQSIFSLIILLMLILRRIISIFNIKICLLNNFDLILKITSFTFFAIITFLSLLSLTIYIVNILNKK